MVRKFSLNNQVKTTIIMKKNYIAPELYFEGMEHASMLCASVVLRDTEMDGSNALTRQNLWGDDEDEE